MQTATPILSPRPSSSLTGFEVLATVRLELILLLLCIGQATRVFLVFPIRAQAMKDLFMGMKVELARHTQLVMAFSDLINSYPILALGVTALLLATLVWGIRLLLESAQSAHHRGGDALARTQVFTTVTLTMVLLGLVFLGTFIDQSIQSPMLKLIASFD